MDDIDYLILNRREAEQWQLEHPADDAVPLSNLHPGCWMQYDEDDPVAILALDNNRIVGRIILRYSDILVNGSIKRFMVGGGLFVLEEYRNRAIGVKILGKILKLDIPYLASGLSGSMAGIVENWRSFHKIDNSPVYGVGLSFFGSLRLGRLDLTRRHDQGQRIRLPRAILILARQWFTRLRLRATASGFSALVPEEAIAKLEEVLTSWRAEVQVPWARKRLVDALRSADVSQYHAWVVRQKAEPTRQAYFVSLYLQTINASVMSTRDIRPLTTARLIEIFPPVADREVARKLLAFVYRRARKLGADILFCFAMTSALRDACEALQMDNLFSKSVYVGLNRVDDELQRLIINADAWWCRAENEEQFSEAFHPRNSEEPVPTVIIR
jgi:GNAT superfamily N-acetyltransferase